MANHEIREQYNGNCGCNKCNTYAEITENYFGCVEVEVCNDSNPCDECTDFSGKRHTDSFKNNFIGF